MKNLTWICMLLLCMNTTMTGQNNECPVVFDNLSDDVIELINPYDYYYYYNTSQRFDFTISEPTILSRIDLAVLHGSENEGWEEEWEEEGGTFFHTPSFGDLQNASVGLYGSGTNLGWSMNNIPAHTTGGYVGIHAIDLTNQPIWHGQGNFETGQGAVLEPGQYSLYVSIYHHSTDWVQTNLTSYYNVYGCPADNGDRDGDGIPNEEDNCPDLVDTENPILHGVFDILDRHGSDKADLEINYSGSDNCDPDVEINAYIKLPDTEGFEVEFKDKSKYKVKIDNKKQLVKVEGPDPVAFWQSISTKGGFEVSPGDVFEFDSKEKEEGKEKYEFKFSDEDELDKIKAPVCALYCEATDQAGNTGHSQADFIIEENLSAGVSNKNRVEVSTMFASKAFEMNIYPNPASGMVRFVLPESNSETHLILYNATGHMIWQKKLNTEKTLSTDLEISAYNNGLYYVQLIQGEDISIKKLIISN
ncbi:MAG: T9SS type A sorting domain-containing protein [Saprospiraceae bacterium]|nr:T9SS type A sorting domain-containing protein [Saprospiraceae bacterium]